MISLTARRLKLKYCRVCKAKFKPFQSLQIVCGVDCAKQHAAKKVERDKKREFLEAKRKFRDHDRSWWLKATQTEVNKYVRLRDKDKPCITCGKPPEGSEKHLRGSGRDAGHYLTRAAYSALRFDTRQIHAQCVTCNRYNSGRRHEFRLAMIDMHGLDFVEWLESQRDPKRWSVEELKAIREKYKLKIKKEDFL